MAVTIEKHELGIFVIIDGKINAINGHVASIIPSPSSDDYIIITINYQQNTQDLEFSINELDEFQPNPDRNAIIRELAGRLAPNSSNILFSAFMRDVTMNPDANRDFSAQPTDFVFTATEETAITDITVFYQDNGSLDSGSYGNNIQLTNGIRLFLDRPGTLYPLFEEKTILVNPDWARHGFSVDVYSWGSGAQSLKAEADLIRIFGKPIILNVGDKILFRLNDDFDNLNSQNFKVSGYLTKNIYSF